MAKLNNKVSALCSISMLLLILSPFFNSSFESAFGISLNFVYLLSAILLLVKILMSKKITVEIWLLNFYILCSILFFTAILIGVSTLGTSLTEIKVLSIAIGLILSILMIFTGKDYLNYFTKFSRKHFNKICFLALIICLRDINTLIYSITTGSRTLYDSSPISIAIICGLGIICTIHKRRISKLDKCIVIIFTLCMLAMLSRGPLVALYLVILMRLLSQSRYAFVMLINLIGVLCAFVIYSLRGGNASHSSSERMILVMDAVDAVSANAIWGYLGRFKEFSNFHYPHNLLLELWIEVGLLGMLTFFSSICLCAFFLLLKKDTKNQNALLFASFYMFLSICMLFSLPSMELMKLYIPLTMMALMCVSNFRKIQEL